MALAPVKSRALVVEDQPALAITIGDLLRRINFDVTVAVTGQQAINLAQANEFDLVTLDIDLPDMSGIAVCEYLKQDFRFSRTPVIFLSGHVSIEDRKRAFDVGGADFIEKPFDTFLFVSRVLSHVKPK